MLKKLILAAAGIALAAPAFADGWHGHRGYYGHYEHERHPVFVRYRPVYVVPPVYSYPPRVAIAAPLAPGVSIRLDLPL